MYPWEANARVASVSPVPIMLDDPICALADVEPAGGIKNISFCKLKKAGPDMASAGDHFR